MPSDAMRDSSAGVTSTIPARDFERPLSIALEFVDGAVDPRAEGGPVEHDAGAEKPAALRPRPGDAAEYSLRVALRELGRRVEFLDAQIERLDDLIVPLVTARAPGLLSLYGVGPDTAALLLIAAGDHPERLRSEAAWAHMCAVAPIPASSGKTRRHRLNRGGNREANHALWRIVITRMSAHPETRAYVQRRTAEGLSKKEIIRCLKRYVAREVYPLPARLTRKPPGRPDPLIGCRRSAGLRTIRRPPRAILELLTIVT